MYSLRYENDRGEIRRIDVDKDVFAIGRLEDNDLVLEEINVSRKHAILEVRSEGLVLVDPGSRYGIRMNSAQLPRETLLRGGDNFYLGDFRFELIASDADSAPVDAATIRMTSIREEDVADKAPSPSSAPEKPASSVLDEAVGVPYTVAVNEDETLKVLLEMRRRNTASVKPADIADEDRFIFETPADEDRRSRMTRTILVSLMIAATLLIAWLLYMFWMDSELNLGRINRLPEHVAAFAAVFMVSRRL